MDVISRQHGLHVAAGRGIGEAHLGMRRAPEEARLADCAAFGAGERIAASGALLALHGAADEQLELPLLNVCADRACTAGRLRRRCSRCRRRTSGSA